MEDVIIKGIGCWLLLIIQALFVFIAYMIGHFVNTIPAEFAVMVGTMLGASQVLAFLIIKHYFKIVE